MRKRISESLSIKVFLWVFTALAFCCLGIYALVMLMIPQRYQLVSAGQLAYNVDAFIRELESSTYEDARDNIYNFCIENNTVATLIGDGETLTFGELAGQQGSGVSSSSFTQNIHFKNKAGQYTLVLTSISKTEDEISAVFLKILPLVIGVILLISALSALICSRVIVSPITRISEISKRMTELDMTWQCEGGRSDEIGTLADSLNTMARRLKASMDALETANLRLQDANKQLSCANRQLKADVDKFKTLEEQRRQFFTAVSHELKTPLTILKGQLENMVLGLGDYKNHDKYLPQALDAAESIEYLVRELLSISRMEAMDMEETLENVLLWEMVEAAVRDISTLANTRAIHIHKEAEKDIEMMYVYVNRGLFARVLSNILSNAVRHSPVGADVFIRLKRSGGHTELEMENTGTAIAPEDMPHMFTPFYRADKSRSKTTGGSGLGLYIVKTILDLHRMSCRIENTDMGVRFCMTLDGPMRGTPLKNGLQEN